MSVREEHALARSVGEFVRTINEAGLYNHDHKLSNIIRCEDGEFGIIDTVAISGAACIAEPSFMLLTMLKEAQGVGLLPRRTLLMRCLQFGVGGEDPLSEEWRFIEQSLENAGDTTPKVSPLSRTPTSAS
jgi:hypothetical protein